MTRRELLDGACPRCGGTGQHVAVNPAWMVARRKAAGLTLRDVARRLEFSAAYVCDMEKGRRAVSVKVHAFYKSLKGPRP